MNVKHDFEGFICPCCMVNLPSSSQLQDHWIRFHGSSSGKAKSQPGYVNIPAPERLYNGEQNDTSSKQNINDLTGCIQESKTIKRKMFHVFKKSSTPQPIICEFCGSIIWRQSMQCIACGFQCHKDCEPLIVTLCENWPGLSSNIAEDCDSKIPTSANTGPIPSPKGFVSQIRHQISRGKSRHVDETFDLDLTYITDRIIAMSFPASGLESAYRNSLMDVATMLQQKHGHNYMVFNVSERRYDISKLNNQVLDFGWPDHLAPPLERLVSIIKSIDSWLCSDDHHVAVVHCKGGKGRTGVVISAYIQFNKVCPSPQAALDWFALRRFYDTKFGGVTQPSQRRYVHYFGDFLENKLKIRNRTLLLNHIIIHGIPNFDGKGGCRPFVRLFQGYQLIHTSEVYVSNYDSESICLNFYGLAVTGDIMVKCCQKGNIPSFQDTVFRCQFNTDAINDCRLVLQKKELDVAYKDRRFPESCSVEFIFKLANEQDLQEENIAAAFKSLTSDSGIESPVKLAMKGSSTEAISRYDIPSKDDWLKGLRRHHMENEVVGNAHLESLPVPEHIAGPLNGDPYALVDRTLFGALKPNCNENIKMQHSSATPTSFDLTKGITDLDNLLSDLGFLTSSCKTDHGAAIIKRDENSNFSCLPSNDGVDTITTRLPTINVVGVESSKSKAEFNEAAATKSSNEANCVNASEVRVKPRLPARTSSFGAVSRHHKGSLGRSESEDGRSTSGSSQSSRANNYHENVGSDDVFNYDGPLSPTVSDMLSELSNSPLAADSRNNWPTKRPRNFSTKYDNVVEHSSDCDKESAGEFRQGRVKDHVKQFNRILSSPDPSKVGTGVPMPGLVQGIDFEDKISKFNYRSLAPGQCGPIPEHLYMAGSPPKRIVYEIEEDEAPAVEAENLFIPSYADRPAAYYLKEREKARQQQGMKLSNGHVPVDEFVPDGHSVNTSCEISDGEREGRARADSAYGGSMRSSSVASTSVTSNAAAVAKTRNENCKSSGRGSHASSVTSLDDEDSSGYARIEDIQPTKEELQNSSSPVAMEAESELIKEQEVIAVSHTVPHKGFQDRMKNRVPEIKSKKDLSLAVYQTNYLPGLTNGQPTVLSSSQIDLEDESFQSETDGRQDNSKLVNGQCSPVPAASPPQDRSHLVLESRDLTSKAGSEGSLGPGIHIVESPPSPCCSAKSDSSSITLSPTRKTLRHRLRRSNSSTSSLSSSELFPEVLRYPHVKFDKDTLKFWYKPKITRDEAMAILKDKSPGTFVVRDSQSYEGAFGLAVKVATPPLGVIQQAGGDISKINMENELIRHFLIEPCKQGVRLKGSNNEPAFPSLVALVFQHSVTKMALPIELKLPTEDIENLDEVDGPSGLTEQQVLQKGAACNLVYLSCIDVEGLTGDGAVKYSINKTLSTNYHVKSTVVTIKVNQDGITLTDDERRLFFRKHYSIKDVLFCVMDPRGRRFNLHDVIPETTHQAPCFGVVVSKPQKPLEHECIVFAEMEPSQPASAVIDFIQRAMKMVKQ